MMWDWGFLDTRGGKTRRSFRFNRERGVNAERNLGDITTGGKPGQAEQSTTIAKRTDYIGWSKRSEVADGIGGEEKRF